MSTSDPQVPQDKTATSKHDAGKPNAARPVVSSEVQRLRMLAVGAVGLIAAVALVAITSAPSRPTGDKSTGDKSVSVTPPVASRPTGQATEGTTPKAAVSPAPMPAPQPSGQPIQSTVAPKPGTVTAAPQPPTPTTQRASTPPGKDVEPKGPNVAAATAPASAPTMAPPASAPKSMPEASATPPAPAAAPVANPGPPPPQSARTTVEARRTGAAPSQAPSPSMKIQEITTPLGIKAWLVEEKSVPLMALRFGFDGGSAQDPTGKEGVSNFITGMLDEGAGDLDAISFQKRMEELAMRMSFDTSADQFYGSFETLSENRKEAIDLLALALQKPRFAGDALERVRAQLKAGLIYAARNPSSVAGDATMKLIYGDHPYGKSSKGTAQSLDAITAADLEAYRKRIFARDTLRVVAVGDITAKELAETLDKLFGTLPAKAELVPVVPVVAKATEKLKIIDMAVPQSEVRFGVPAMTRHDKDFIPAFVLNHIIGGGGFSARLMEEVREKRGLAYSAYSYLLPMKKSGVFLGGVATKNEQVATSIDVIRNELKRIATEGPTETELANAKSNLIGSFALRFDTNAKIASQLLYFAMEDLGVGYVSKRNAEIEAVTVEDAKRAAKRLLDNDELFFLVVGKPQGLTK